MWGDTHTWYADDPDRPCFTCGNPPNTRYPDGSPKYGCRHTPILGRTPLLLGLALTLTLDRRDQDRALRCAECRNRKPVRSDAWGSKALADPLARLDANLVGAGGEIAFARLIGSPWRCDCDRAYGKPDVGGYQVRTRRNPDTARLIVHEKDAGRPVVLMVGTMPTFTLVGWLADGKSGQRRAWRDDPGQRRAAWFVPRDALASPWTIPELAARLPGGVQSGRQPSTDTED